MNKKLLLATFLVGLSFSIYAQCVQCAGTLELLGTNASVMGTGCSATGHSAVAAGNSASASGNYSTALGHHAYANGIYAVAIGKNALSQDSSFVFGKDISVTANNSIIIGSGFNSTTKLINNISNSIMLGIHSSTPAITIRQNSSRDTPPLVGIGTTNPKKDFHVNGIMMLSGTGNSLLFASSSSSNYGDFGIKLTNDGLNFFRPNNGSPINNLLYISSNGNIGIGTSTSEHKLSVNGTIQAKKVIVTMLANDWPDYVFDPEYRPINLEELGQYVKYEKHLPGVPSANEISSEGLNVGEMNVILLQKIEELTLYVIELQKQIDELKTK